MKMKGSFFQRHLVEESFAVAKAWPEQVKLSEGAKPLNAEFEHWTRQLEGQANGLVEIKGTAGPVNGIPEEHGSSVMVNGMFTDGGLEDEGAAAQRIRLRK